MKKYTETRYLTTTDLRALCIENDWYTCGDNEEYCALFNRLYDGDGYSVNLDTEKLAEIAQDIMDHSDITEYTITTVMYVLAKRCSVFFEEV